MEAHQALGRIDQLKAELDALRPLAPEAEQRIMQKLRLDWNYHSNAIEGNTLTQGETRIFLLYGLTAKGKPLRDHLDIKGHDEAIDYLVERVRREEPLTEVMIRGLHKLILGEPHRIEAQAPDGRMITKEIVPGRYKLEPNHVRTVTGKVHYYASPEETPARMQELVEWHRAEEEKGALHPLVRATLFHHRFTAIHPFDDGNGRTARILSNLILIRFHLHVHLGLGGFSLELTAPANANIARGQYDGVFTEEKINAYAARILDLLYKGIDRLAKS